MRTGQLCEHETGGTREDNTQPFHFTGLSAQERKAVFWLISLGPQPCPPQVEPLSPSLVVTSKKSGILCGDGVTMSQRLS